MLLAVPGDAEAARRSPAAQNVDGGDDLAQVRDIAVRDAGDKGSEPPALGDGGQVSERRPALEEVLPRPPDLRDLPEVIHHPDGIEAGFLGGRGDAAQPCRRLGGPTGPRVAAEVQAEPKLGRLLALEGCRGRGG